MIKKLIKRLLGRNTDTSPSAEPDIKVTHHTLVSCPKDNEWENEFLLYKSFSASDIRIDIMFRENEFNDAEKEKFFEFIQDGINNGAGGEVFTVFCVVYSDYNIGVATKGNPEDNSLKLFIGKENIE